MLQLFRMEEKIREMLAKLKFSDEKARKIFKINEHHLVRMVGKPGKWAN